MLKKSLVIVLCLFIFLSAYMSINLPHVFAQTESFKAKFSLDTGVALLSKGDVKLEFLYESGTFNSDSIIWGSDDTAIAFLKNNDKNNNTAWFTPKKQGTANLWAAAQTNDGTALQARMQITVFEKAETIDIIVDKGGKNFLSPSSDVVLEVNVNGKSNLLNDLVTWNITDSQGDVVFTGITENLSKIKISNLKKGSYTAYCLIGETEKQLTFSVISQSMHLFLTVFLPYLSLLLVLGVIAFGFIKKRKNPFDKCEIKAVKILNKIEKTLTDSSKKRFMYRGFDALFSTGHLLFLADDLTNSMYDINLNIVTQCQSILNKTKELSDILNAFYHSQKLLSENQQTKILSDLKDVFLPDLIASLKEASVAYERNKKINKPDERLFNVKTYNKNGQKNNLNYLYEKFDLNDKNN